MNEHDSIDAVIVAAGSGTRLGHALPKAFVPLGGSPMLLYSLRVLSTHPAIRRTIIVVPQNMMAQTEALVNRAPLGDITVTCGGPERWNSVSNGISESTAQWVLVHDAARPFVSAQVIDAVLAKRASYDCVITATPVADTIRTFTDDKAGETIDRSHLIRVGTPQLFRRKLLLEALGNANTSKADLTDEAMLMQRIGMAVGIAWGDPRNFKITTHEDLDIAEALIARTATLHLGG